MKTTVIYNARLVDANTDQAGAVIAKNGKIENVVLKETKTLDEAQKLAMDLENAQFIDAENLCLMPAFIDTHAHFRYPGQTQKEDLESGLSAAEAGGFGTVVLMPNTSPVVSDSTLAEKIVSEAAQKSPVQVFQTLSLTRDFGGEDTSHLDSIDSKRIPVISEDGRDVKSSAIMLNAMKIAARKNVVVACHSEDCDLAAKAKILRGEALKILKSENISLGKYICANPDFAKDGKLSENAEKARKIFEEAHNLLALAEDLATERNLEIARAANCAVHICHCSTAQSLKSVIQAKKVGAKASVEITPHHLFLSRKNAPLCDLALVNPPIREESDRLFLIESLKNGNADCIGTDHAPHTLSDKNAGAPGFPGLETAFALCNTELCKNNGFSLSKLSQLMSANAAKILNLNEGLLKQGFCAKFVLVNPDEKWTVDSGKFKTKGKSTPFDGMTLFGKVVRTIFC